MKNFNLPLLAVLLWFSILPAPAKQIKLPSSGKEFSREEYMVMNLNKGNDSTGTHISEALKEVRAMVKDLDRSLRQLQQVDREFARSKGKPDDRFMAPASATLEQALKTAQQLAQELEGSREQLKDSIHQALIMGQ